MLVFGTDLVSVSETDPGIIFRTDPEKHTVDIFGIGCRIKIAEDIKQIFKRGPVRRPQEVRKCV